MGKYIKLFDTHAEYETFKQTSDFIFPNVSHCIEEQHVHYNPYDTRLRIVYNITDTDNETSILRNPTWVDKMEIDGVSQPNIILSYKFDTTGEHTVTYYVKDDLIGGGAFTYIDNIVSVSIPDSVKKIEGSAFSSCYNLTTVTFGKNIEEIQQYVFQNCRKIEELKLPNKLKTLGSWAFYQCDSIKTITIPSSVTTIVSGAFQSCDSLETAIINNTIVGQKEFYECRNLKNVTLSNNITSIGEYAFQSCNSLTSITIPSSITSIGYTAFEDCSSLTSVTVEATTPPTLGNSAFNNTNNCPIYVPSESVEIYKVANGWSNYASRIQAIP